MATYAELKTRIITEMVRDDLSDDLATQLTTHIARACEYYANQRFWFNAIVTTVNTVANTATVAIPTTVRRIDRLTIPANYVELIESTLPDLDDVGHTTVGRPERYAYYNDYVRLYPVPDAIYTLRIYGTAQIAAPSSDSDTNVWTTEAQDLIVAHTKMTLSRDQFRDPEGTQLFMGAVQDSLTRLRRETAQRLRTQLRAKADAPWSRIDYTA
jgi:hypothetical protein